MAKVLVTDTYLTNIGNAIREKNGETTAYKPSEMAAAIQAISGGGDQPQLNAPTIKITEDTLTITANKNNGNFVTGYNVYVNPGTGYVMYRTVTTLINDMTQYQIPQGDYSIKVTAVGENFIESDYSNELNYTNVFYTVTNMLTNCTSNNSTTSIRKGSAYSATITANSGYVLKDTDVAITMNDENISSTAYSDSVITIGSASGNIVITISATKLNGVQWIATAAPNATGYRLLTEHNNEAYAMLGYSKFYTAKSSDGVSWTAVEKGTTTPISNIIALDSYGSGMIAYTNSIYAYASEDGTWSGEKQSMTGSGTYTFTSQAMNKSAPKILSFWKGQAQWITPNAGTLSSSNQFMSTSPTNKERTYGAFGNSKYVMCEGGSNRFWITSNTSSLEYKTASITFPKRTFDTTYNVSNYPQQHQMIYANGMFVIKGTGTQVAYSTDGENWALAGTADDSSDDRFNVAYGDGSWIAVSPNGKEAFSNNGIDWEVHEIDYKPKDIIFCNGKFIAVESETSNSKIIYGVV